MKSEAADSEKGVTNASAPRVAKWRGPLEDALLEWGAGLVAASLVGVVVWGSETAQLRAGKGAPSVVTCLSVTALSALLVQLAGAIAALTSVVLRRSRVMERCRRVSAQRWLYSAGMALGLAVGTYGLYLVAAHFLVAEGTRALFLAWTVANGGVLLALGLRRALERLSTEKLGSPSERTLVTGGILLGLALLSLLFFEREVFVGLDGAVWAPVALAVLLGALGPYWLPPRRILAGVGAALVGLSLSLWLYGGKELERGMRFRVEQHTRLTRKLLDFSAGGQAPVRAASSGASGSCRPGRTPLRPEKLDKPDKGGADILLITVDGVRWDHTPMGGYKRNTMPRLKKFAERGTVFTHAYSNSASTRQTFRSLLSGLLPSQVGVSRGKSKWAMSFPREQLTLAHYLAAAGLKTITLQTNPVFMEGKSRGLAGFEVKDFTPAAAWKGTGHSADYHVDRLIAHLSDYKERRPRFVFSHMMEPHQPFRKGPGVKSYGKSRRDRYDTSLRYVDTQLDRALRFALSPARRNKTYVIVASDHGMGVGDRNNLAQHGNSVYDDQVRVPLIIFGPKVKAQKVHVPTSLNDLFPTIVDMAGLDPMAHVCGKSLLPVALGKEKQTARPVLVELVPDHANRNFKMAMVDGRYKLVVDARKKRRGLFDLKKDPEETRDLTEERPELLKKLEARLTAELLELGRDPKAYDLAP